MNLPVLNFCFFLYIHFLPPKKFSPPAGACGAFLHPNMERTHNHIYESAAFFRSQIVLIMFYLFARRRRENLAISSHVFRFRKGKLHVLINIFVWNISMYIHIFRARILYIHFLVPIYIFLHTCFRLHPKKNSI